jgi:hypothetical protein
MALLHVPGCARITCHGVIQGTQIANVFHVRNITFQPWTQTEINAITTGVSLAYAAQFAPLGTTTFTYTGADGVDLTNDVGVTANVPASTPGIRSATGVSNATSCCITWKTAAHFRGGHARTYLPPPATSDITLGNTWTGAYSTAVQTAASAFITAVNGITSSIVPSLSLVRRIRNGAPINPPETYVITGALVDSRVDTMRRRLGKDR